MTTVAIIGHGPSMTNKGRGSEIDCHDVVIRMVECDWQPVDDYGEKYDIGFYADGPSLNWLKKSIHIPNKGYWYYRTDKEIRRGKDYNSDTRGKVTKVLCESIVKWEDTLMEGFHLSRGLAATMTAIEIYRPIKLSLYGFDAVISGYAGRFKHHPKVFRNYLPHTHKLLKGGNTHD